MNPSFLMRILIIIPTGLRRIQMCLSLGKDGTVLLANVIGKCLVMKVCLYFGRRNSSGDELFVSASGRYALGPRVRYTVHISPNGEVILIFMKPRNQNAMDQCNHAHNEKIIRKAACRIPHCGAFSPFTSARMAATSSAVLPRFLFPTFSSPSTVSSATVR